MVIVSWWRWSAGWPRSCCWRRCGDCVVVEIVGGGEEGGVGGQGGRVGLASSERHQPETQREEREGERDRLTDRETENGKGRGEMLGSKDVGGGIVENG